MHAFIVSISVIKEYAAFIKHKKTKNTANTYAHVLVGLHDLLDARERQLVGLEIERVRVDLRDLLDLRLPERVQL
jgi:hypothetical protein